MTDTIHRRWDLVIPGTFTMHITSLHIFAADHKILFKERK